MRLYPKLAWEGIRKNKRLYLPYILTCIAMIAMQYIITFLANSPLMLSMKGGNTITSLLGFGTYVMALFSLIFLFYTSSFLSRRRKKEFGLYNILGMGKRNIGRILLWETCLTALISLLAGLAIGIALSKIAELVLVNIMQGTVSYNYSISGFALLFTVGLFALIFLLILLNMLIRVRASNPIALLNSESAGEKPPKANWFFGALGVAVLAAAYYVAVTIQDPIATLGWFFIAVIMVIVATYLVFIASSVVFCRLLQKNKNYYYKKNHFVSVSSMVYRMKRNGAGLASICILATMVLVTLSTTTTLYIGAEDSLAARYPRQICTGARMDRYSAMSDENIGTIRDTILEVCREQGVTLSGVYDYRYVEMLGELQGDKLQTDESKISETAVISMDNVYQVYLLPLSDYNRIENTNETLGANEALVYAARFRYPSDTLELLGGDRLSIKKQIGAFSGANGISMVSVVPSMYVIVADPEAALGSLLTPQSNERIAAQLKWDFGFDTQLDVDGQIALARAINEKVAALDKSGTYGMGSYFVECKELNRGDFYGTYGGAFFLGILLSIVFLLAAVLIIYYKQISEGYEDQSRFEIMQKVGMTSKEIRRSINSQMLTVFFLPLGAAGIHLAFAFPMIRKMLVLFNLNNVTLYALVTAGSFVLFALFYVIVYRITANAYFHIVSGANGRE